MSSPKVSVSGLVAIAGAAILLASSNTSSAFTLSSPSLEKLYADATVEPVSWDHGDHWRWRHWHRGEWRRWHHWGWGWRRPAYGFYGSVPRCWIGPWGDRHCA